MTTQPEALRLADLIEEDPMTTWGYREASHAAAAELRRLHAENERLHQINQSHEMKLSVRGYELQIEDLKAVNQELLEALIHIGFAAMDITCERKTIRDAARAAIAKAEGQA